MTDVPLTPYEQRALATIEDRLGADDPDLAATLRRGRPASELRRWTRPVVALVAVSVVLAVHPLVDPIDIRLRIGPCRRRPWLAGRQLCWSPSTGWSITHRAGTPHAYYAGPSATPLAMVPTAVEVVRWAAGAIDGPAAPPFGVELDDDPRAIQRLLAMATGDPVARRTG